MSDDPNDRYLVATDLTTESYDTAVVRDPAFQARVKSSDTAALPRAALGRSRVPPKTPAAE
eukprot:10556157-Karenia_brevis.AAC.1